MYKHLATLLSGIFVVVLGLVFVLAMNSQAGKTDKLYGWAWTSNVGWLSLNCYNPEIGSTCTNDYGVDFDLDTNNLNGTAWSEYGGWMCFGDTCDTWGGTVPGGGAPDVTISSMGLLSGWSKWQVLGDNGWNKLQGPSIAPTGVHGYCVNCDATAEECTLCLRDVNMDTASGEICSECSRCFTDPDGYDCLACTSCYEYGVGIDYEKATLIGWGWNGDLTRDYGFGWLAFRHSQNPDATVNPPYLSTKYGDIYSQEGIGSLFAFPPPDGKFTGTFLLQTNGRVLHYDSCMRETGGASAECLNLGEGSSAGWKIEGEDIDFPEAATGYSNTFGQIDLKGLFGGQYGDRENIASELDIDNPLAGKVYYYDGDLIINSATTFLNGITSSGAGTLIVRGNLTIDDDLTYESANPANLSQLATFGIIVIDDGSTTKGQVTIGRPVQNLAANIYAENKITTAAGVTQLTVKGLLISREFDFNRSFADIDTLEPAEEIIYDGRVIANPPPGFNDLSKDLPKWFGAN